MVANIYRKAVKMPYVCSVAVCLVSSRFSKVQFHKFSKNTDFNTETGRVCGTYFFNDDNFETKTSGLKKMKPDAILGKNLIMENQDGMSSRIQRARTKQKS